LITITDINFTEVMSEIHVYSIDYLGKEITMTGFVYKDAEFSPRQLALVRYVVVCCTADAAPYGLLCEWDGAGTYGQGTWLDIRGRIEMGRHQNRSIPTLKPVTVKKSEKPPKDPYIYPAY
jgi:putative membrane protein